jgi:hypothetical protein
MRVPTRRATAVVLAVALTAALAACQSPPDWTATPVTPSSTPTAPATEVPALSTWDEAAGVEANRVLVDTTLQAVMEADGEPGGRELVDALEGVGVPRESLEVTADATAIGRAVDTVQVAARVGESCVVGQVQAGQYRSAVTDLLGTGRCLVGITRAIDW